MSKHTANLVGLAERNLGLITVAAAKEASVGARAVYRAQVEGLLDVVHPGVFRLRGSATSETQRLLAAQLAVGPGAAISHRSAARQTGLTERFADVVELSVPDGRHPHLAGVVVHRSSDLSPRHLRWRDGLRITTVERTLVDLGAVTGRGPVAEAMEQALIDRKTTVDRLCAHLDELGGRGRRGRVALQAALEEWLLSEHPPDSHLEVLFARLLRTFGLASGRFQHEVRLEGRFVARVDWAWPPSSVVVEVDGLGARRTAARLQRDLDRQNRLVTAGLTVIRFTWPDVVRRPETVAARLRPVLEQAGIGARRCENRAS